MKKILSMLLSATLICSFVLPCFCYKQNGQADVSHERKVSHCCL